MKKDMKLKLVIFGCLFLLPQLALAGVRILPLADLQILGGNSYFEGERSSFKGNIYLDIVPALEFSDRFYLLPRYSGSYAGNQEAGELESGEHLLQEIQSHDLSLKLINNFRPDLKAKAKIGYARELTIETEDESWGNGLYDYDQTTGSLELEKISTKGRIPFTISGGGSFYTVRFPNYDSLASGSDTSTAGLESVGKDIQDYDAKEIFVETDLAISPNIISKAGYIYTHKGYADQRLVTASGEYESVKREDDVHDLDLSLNYSLLAKIRATLGLSYQLRLNRSNQNHYDASRYEFIPNFYSYTQHSIGPEITLYLPYSLTLFLSYEYERKDYQDRLIQDKEGEYGDNHLYLRTHTANLSLSYPLRRNLYLKAETGYKKAGSNMEYEEVYRYNYTCGHYLFGLSYEY